MDPPEKWPQKSIKMSKKSLFEELNVQKREFLDILIGFWGHFSGGVQNGIFRTLKCTFGVLGFRGSVGGPGICKSRGKNCLPAVSRQFLTRNYPRPNCLLKCLPNCLSPTREGFLSSFKSNPAVRVIARQVRDKNCLAAIFAPRHQSVSSGPLGGRAQDRTQARVWMAPPETVTDF